MRVSSWFQKSATRRCSMSPKQRLPSTRSWNLSANEKGRLRYEPPFAFSWPGRTLLQLDGAAGILDLLLDLLGLFLVDAFLDRLRGAFDQRLRLAEAKAGDRADFLDHVDLLAAVAGENDVELGLLFSRSRCGSAAAGSRTRNRDRSRGGDAPLLFERLGEIRGFEDGQFGKLVDQLGDVSHLILLGGPSALVVVR